MRTSDKKSGRVLLTTLRWVRAALRQEMACVQFLKSLRRCRRGKQGVQRDAEGVRESIRHPINVISSFSFIDLQILGLETAFLDTTVIMNIDEQHA